MGGNHQQLCLVHADDEFTTDRTDELGRPRYANPGRLLGDKADFGLFEGLQEIVIHPCFDQMRDQVGDGLAMMG